MENLTFEGLPFAVRLARVVTPRESPDGSPVNSPTADDEDRMGLTTYTDDPDR